MSVKGRAEAESALAELGLPGQRSKYESTHLHTRGAGQTT